MKNTDSFMKSSALREMLIIRQAQPTADRESVFQNSASGAVCLNLYALFLAARCGVRFTVSSAEKMKERNNNEKFQRKAL